MSTLSSCDYLYKRHSKSIDTQRKLCGICRGKLELNQWDAKVEKYVKLVQNKEPIDGEAKVQKTPNPFAAFVKENYKYCRTPGTTHGDAMKELSKMFSATKITK